MIGNEFDSWAMTHYKATKGYYGREPLPLMAGLWDDNGTLKALAINGAGTVGFKYLAGGSGLTDDIVGLVWGATADSTDSWVYPWTLPHNYRRDTGSGGRSAVILRVKCRKLDLGGATDNADLELNCMASWHNSTLSETAATESDGDTAFNVLAAVVKGTTLAGATILPAMAVADSEAAFRWIEFDITGGMTATQLAALKPGATMTFKLFPHEAVGTSLNVEVSDIEVVYTRHLMPTNKFRRDRAIRA